MSKHSPLIALQNAKRERDSAEQECPHWDFEGDDFVGLNCCYALQEAREKVRAARKKVAKSERQ